MTVMWKIAAPVFLLFLILIGCTAKVPEPVAISIPDRTIDYLAEVKPILDKRCTVCHSCYNSPCQLKLSSYEGFDRGASKEAVYNASRLRTMEPTRLFVDAQTTGEWRQKKFFSVTESTVSGNRNNSILIQLLSHKMNNPASSGDYFPEANDLTCSKDQKELSSYLKKHPNRGMPFGFPPLKQQEFEIIGGWLAQGAKGPTPEQQIKLASPDTPDVQTIKRWETFLNQDDPKHAMTARYLYEHLFLAHITFGTETNDFYEMVRSKTGPDEPIDLITTVRPYDEPGTERVFYRFRKIHSTIVYKTHMVFPLTDAELERIKELFIEPEWLQEPYLVGYDPIVSANPFEVFEQMPARSRYQFLLDNAHYIIMTFIRGPVCKGQVALNVIHDHFWVLFLDPDHDLTVKYPGFLKLHYTNLRLPGEKGSEYKLSKVLLKNKHYKGAVDYYKARQQFYGALYPDGMGLDFIWQGNQPDDQPVLTVFRHFDSASVHRGVLGNMPNTMWVIDFPLLERIYYSLVAGFDIYGNVGHQLATRLYMDALRVEGESYFLDFMPRDKRKTMMEFWYTGVPFKDVHYHPAPVPAGGSYMTDDPKREFIEQVVNSHIQVEGIAFGHNYLPAGASYPELPEKYESAEDLLQGFVAVSAPGVSFFHHVSGHNANVAWVRITNMPGNKDAVVSMVVNRWHDNVRFLFKEKQFLDPEKDRVDFLPGFIGSYPNYFFVVDISDLPDFFDILDNYDGSEQYIQRLEKYGVNRAENNFWEVYDWFQERFTMEQPVRSGLFDLNRYYHKAM